MDIVDGRIAARRGVTGRTTAVGLALVAALSGAFALGRSTTSTQDGIRHETVSPRVVLVESRPVIRPRGHGAVKVDPGRTAAEHVRHSVKWG